VRRENGEQNWAKKKKAAEKRCFFMKSLQIPLLIFQSFIRKYYLDQLDPEQRIRTLFLKCFINLINISLKQNY